MQKDNLGMNMNEYLPLRDVVFNTLREAILKGELRPGERLMEIQLAQRLGVSRTPIREAIRKLELEGLVLMVPRKGAEVAKITEKSMQDVLEVRRALEALAIQLACERITEEEIALLETNAKEFEKAAKTKDLVLMAEADELFHTVIYSATKNDRLIYIVNNLREQMYRYRLEYLKDESIHVNILKEHEEIVRTVKKRNSQEAVVAISAHIDNQQKSIRNYIKSIR